MASPETENPNVKLSIDKPTASPVTKREVNYTSVSISKESMPFIATLKEAALKQVNATISTQMVMDFAVKMAMDHIDEIGAYAREKIVDPRVADYLRLQKELLAAGLLPDQK